VGAECCFSHETCTTAASQFKKIKASISRRKLIMQISYFNISETNNDNQGISIDYMFSQNEESIQESKFIVPKTTE